MTDVALAEVSRTLFFPTTVALYLGAMLAYLYRLAFTRVARTEGDTAVAGRRALQAATALAAVGVATHGAHLVARALAAGGRVPWGNMFEYSSVMGFGIVLGGLLVFQWRLRRPEVMGFLLVGALLSMGAASLLWTEPGPLVPILNSQWLKIHVAAIVLAATVFTVAFVFNGLYLLREHAERKVAERQTARASGSTVGAAYLGGDVAEADDTEVGAHDPERAIPQRTLPDPDLDEGAPHEYGRALRDAVSPVKLTAGTWLATSVVSWVFWADQGMNGAGALRFVAVNTVLALAALLAWRFLPHLPSATTLDSLTYRTIAFGFPIWTFAVIAGAIWAEQAWGRYWGWDPKETSAFLTWVAYAGYLHTRATHGLRGRGAGWAGIVAFAVLLFTYFAVNLVVTGLHSYAGLD